MNERSVEYVKSLIPSDMPDGRDILEKGRKMGREIHVGRSQFLEEKGYKNFHEYRTECAKTGKQSWMVFMGLASLDEQIEALRYIHEFSQKTGLEFYTVANIASPHVALPKEYRENAPSTTSYVINGAEDWEAHKKCNVPLELLFEDHHMASPNAIETTVNALKVGSSRVGLVSQFIWAQPGYTDHKQHMIDFVKSLGIVSSKWDEYIGVDTYMDDGFPGYAMDCVTYVGYALLEHHIVSDLCKCRYQVAWGGLLLDPIPRLSIGIAIHKLLKKDEWLPLSYVNGSTVYQWADPLNANFGPCVQEMMLQGLMTRKYKMGLQQNAIAITEKLCVPTVQGLMDSFSAGARALENADQLDAIINWEPFEKTADILMEEGQKFYENTLRVLEEAGVNMEDPLEIFMTLKNLNPSKFEATFHHNVDEKGNVVPFVPTVLGRQTIDLQEKTIAELHEKGLTGEELKGMRIALASGDGHSYGLLFMDNMLSAFGAEITNGGVDVDTASLLDLADEDGIDTIGVSVHNGQALDYAAQLVQLAETRGKKYNIILGGMLNAILPGKSVSEDVTQMVRDLGVYASNDLYEDITKLKEWKDEK